MAGKLPMGQKELVRSKVLAMVVEGKLSLKEGSVRLKVSYRQAKRLVRKYKEQGDQGLIHGLTGKRSNHGADQELRSQVLALYKEKYRGFGPTLASEEMAEREGIDVKVETLRQWLVKEGLWEARRQGPRGYHARRLPRERFGELVQFDGSDHEWFEDRGPRCCLMNMVDDATGRTLAFLTARETTNAAMELLWRWIDAYGIPQAVYCDRKNAFVLTREPTIDEQLKGITPKSPFEKACEKLGIEVIVAYSPEAKGRVERNHGVYQDRFVKELRLEGIHTITAANRYLQEQYLPKINAKFAKTPAKPEDAHVPLLIQTDLRDILCREEVRVVSRDSIIQFERHLYRITKDTFPRPRPRDKVTIHVWLDGSVHIYWKDTPLAVEEFLREYGEDKEEPLAACCP